MNERFHAYPLEDRLYAAAHAERLAELEAQAASRLLHFCPSHRAALALSLGKDSMVCLHLARKYRCPLAIILWCSSLIETPDTLELAEYVLVYYDLNNLVVTEPSQEMLQEAWAGRSFEEGQSEFTFHCLEELRWRAMDEYRIDGTILGLRAGESGRRRRNYELRGAEYRNRREEADILTPIVEWTTAEVYAYLARENAPLHPYYGLAARLGRDRHELRVNTLFDARYTEQDAAVLRALYPETMRQVNEIRNMHR